MRHYDVSNLEQIFFGSRATMMFRDESFSSLFQVL
jgi:hypothetical protein